MELKNKVLGPLFQLYVNFEFLILSLWGSMFHKFPIRVEVKYLNLHKAEKNLRTFLISNK